MSNHTPGPWYVKMEYEKDGTPYVDGIYADPEFREKRIVETDSGYYPPKMADAWLIAAAPQMLDALHEIVGKIKAHGNATPLLFGALIKAELAIKKAECR